MSCCSLPMACASAWSTTTSRRQWRRCAASDDATSTPKGIPLSAEVVERLKAASLPVVAPTRGANGSPGNVNKPGTLSANVVQQDYFASVMTRVVLPMFRERNKPFLLVFWSRDPDGTQHNQGDSLNTLTPGINGP